eukprot:1393693-Rhodomonas_salina.2
MALDPVSSVAAKSSGTFQKIESENVRATEGPFTYRAAVPEMMPAVSAMHIVTGSMYPCTVLSQDGTSGCERESRRAGEPANNTGCSAGPGGSPSEKGGGYLVLCRVAVALAVGEDEVVFHVEGEGAGLAGPEERPGPLSHVGGVDVGHLDDAGGPRDHGGDRVQADRTDRVSDLELLLEEAAK